jgi:hypothetical protein
MLVIGSYNELVVEREVDFGFYLNPKEDEVLLPAKYAPPGLSPGDTLRVFVYTDSEDRPIATTLTPLAVVGDFVCLQIKDVQPFGAFLEWGLEKDLLLPKSEMPRPVKPGDRVVVKVCLDITSNRVYATAQLSGHIDKNLEALSEGERVDLMIYNITDLGSQALINDRYSGLLFHSDTFEQLSVGDRTVGYVHHIKADGKIDLLLKMPGYGSVSDSTTHIQDCLKIEGGFIPVNDKSSPDIIKARFSMSKKEFKRAIGGLYKNRMIRITDTGICLVDPDKAAAEAIAPEPSPWEKAMKKRS